MRVQLIYGRVFPADGTRNGSRPVEHAAGEIVDLPSKVAKSLIEKGAAVPVPARRGRPPKVETAARADGAALSTE